MECGEKAWKASVKGFAWRAVIGRVGLRDNPIGISIAIRSLYPVGCGVFVRLEPQEVFTEGVLV